MVEVRLLNMEVGEEVGMKGDMPDPVMEKVSEGVTWLERMGW